MCLTILTSAYSQSSPFYVSKFSFECSVFWALSYDPPTILLPTEVQSLILFLWSRTTHFNCHFRKAIIHVEQREQYCGLFTKSFIAVGTSIKQGCDHSPALFSIFHATMLYLTSNKVPTEVELMFRINNGTQGYYNQGYSDLSST